MEQLVGYAVNHIKETLTRNGIRFEPEGIQKIAKIAVENKADLINVLSKHKNWNPELMSIIMIKDIVRGINLNQYDAAWSAIVGYMDDNAPRNLYYRTKALWKCFLPEEYFTALKTTDGAREFYDYLGKPPKVGQKLTRHFLQEFKDIGVHRYDPNFNAHFDRICEAISPVITKRKFVLSVNPADFLTMSFGGSISGKDRWSSCHNLKEGAYRSGTLAYVTDKLSFIVYLIECEYSDKRIYLCPKLYRQMFAYKGKTLLQSRPYPNQITVDGKNDAILPFVKECLAECEGEENKWRMPPYNITDIVGTVNGSTQYPDYRTYGRAHVLGDAKVDHLDIGSRPRCLECGETHGNSNILYCGEHLVARATCPHCHKKYLPETGVHFKGEIVCPNCVKICNICNSMHWADESHQIMYGGRNGRACSKCFEKECVACEHCGKPAPKNEIVENKKVNKKVCRSCNYNFESQDRMEAQRRSMMWDNEMMEYIINRRNRETTWTTSTTTSGNNRIVTTDHTRMYDDN